MPSNREAFRDEVVELLTEALPESRARAEGGMTIVVWTANGEGEIDLESLYTRVESQRSHREVILEAFVRSIEKSLGPGR